MWHEFAQRQNRALSASHELYFSDEVIKAFDASVKSLNVGNSKFSMEVELTTLGMGILLFVN